MKTRPPVTVTLLGSTGSIGESSLEVIAAGRGAWRVLGLSARSRVRRFAEQVRAFRPEHAVLSDPDLAGDVRLPRGVRLTLGPRGLEDLARDRADILINALVGASGIVPTVLAARTGKRIALANKESLVAAGDLINRELKKSGGAIIPVDSEHSAIYQCLSGASPSEVEKLIITASGGPFRTTPAKRLRSVSPAQALRHPTWTMGAKITIDSATLMNKGLEVIEAHHLFNVPYDKIEVVVHPQSVIHSMVQFTDGSVLAHLGRPDMKIPIQYALTAPVKKHRPGRRVDFAELKRLDFEKPDVRKFPCLELAYAAGRRGGTLPAVMNAANEVAVDAFLRGRLPFTGIPTIIERAMNRHKPGPARTLPEILDADAETRKEAASWV